MANLKSGELHLHELQGVENDQGTAWYILYTKG